MRRRVVTSMLFALAGTVAAQPAPRCRETRWPHERAPWVSDPEDSRTRRLSLAIDADGDGRLDRLEAEGGFGSGFGETRVILSLASGARFELEHAYAFSRIVSSVEIPPGLCGEGRAALRAVLEDALFRRTCPAPDPSLQWLLDSPKRLSWHPGPVTLPDTYAVRSDDCGSWIEYLGHNHAYRDGRPAEPVVLAEDGQRVLLGTPHGVVLTDPKRTAHAWVWVSEGEHKLRWPSVLAARIEGGRAVLTLTRGDGYLELREDDGQPATRTVSVDLETGAVADDHAGPEP